MAARTPNTSAAPEVVDQVVEIRIDQIDMGDRLRPVDPGSAALLGQVMSAEGQYDPIKVCRLPGQTNYRLVTGGHRLEGARLEGWRTIKAIVVGPDAMARRLTEVSENLWRKGLGPIDRAAFVAELITLSKLRAGFDPKKDGRAVSAAVRWQKDLQNQSSDAKDILSLAYGFNAEAAALIGVDERTIKRDLLLHRRLLTDVVAKLRGHPVATNASHLRALAKLNDDDQRAAADLIVTGEVKGAGEAIARLQGRSKPTRDQANLSAFLASFERMAMAERGPALRHLQELEFPRGVRIVFAGDEARSTGENP